MSASALDCAFEQGLDEYPHGVDRAHWWPPARLRNGPRITIASPEQLPEITAGLLGWATRGRLRRSSGQNMLGVARRVWRPRAGT